MTDPDIDLWVGRWLRDFADQGIFTTDTTLAVTSWNAWLERHSGRTGADVVGRNLFIAYPELETRGLDAHYRGALEGKASLLSHLLHGHLLPMISRADHTGPRIMRQRASISPLIRRGAIAGTITIIDDVTERVATEQELRNHRDALERKVEERTRALAAEVRERRDAEERAKSLARRLLNLQEEERRRIARDLHDHLGQHMTALHLKLEMLRRTGSCDGQWQASFVETQQYLQRFERELDDFTSELKLGGIQILGLVSALTDQAARWSKMFGIAAQVESIGLGDERLSADVETTLYRVTQEALTNVARHAQASSVAIVIQRRESDVVLTIEDDGTGFDDDSSMVEARGMGLSGIRERVALLGGAAQIESIAGRGTTIIVTVPARPVDPQNAVSPR